MPRTRKSARARKPDASSSTDHSRAKKRKQDVQIDGTGVRFEWEGDGAKWIQYSNALNGKLADAYEAKKKQVEIDVAPGVKMTVLFKESVQKNKKTGYRRRVRIAMKSDGEDDFNVLEWEGDDKLWHPYDILNSLQLEKALSNEDKSIKTSFDHEINLTKMTQTNPSTGKVRKIRRGCQDSEAPDSDDEDEDEEEEVEEEEPEEIIPVKSSKGKSGRGNSAVISSKSTVKTLLKKGGRAPVDSACPIACKCSVYEKGKDVWDCMLNQTNIGNNNNKFYLIQLLKTDGKDEYHCWKRWGRVGYAGQNDLNHCGSDFEAAKKDFEKKFSDKTGHQWCNRSSFQKYGGKYDLVNIDYNIEGKEDMDVDETTENDTDKRDEPVPDSKLDKKLQDLVQLICDIKSMEDEIVEMKFDTTRAPLGKLTKAQIKAGYSALKEIETLIKKNDFGNNLKEACSNFYTRIPHEFGMQVPPLIRSSQDVKKKLQLLEALEDIEIAIKMLKGGDKSENPIDRHYHQLNCGLKLIDKTTDDFKLIDKYLQMTHASTHMMYKMELEDLFQIDRDGESTRFKDHGNRMLLWHGSRLTNWASILGQGLRIAPPEAPVTGYMFGKGVYFADMSSKSANYCFATKTRSTGIVVLCDVSLGTVDEKYNADPNAAKLPSGKHSVKGLGMTIPDEKTYKTMNDGVVIPLGKETRSAVQKPKTGYSLNYNEFIVYDTCQIKMKYLLKVKFNFK